MNKMKRLAGKKILLVAVALCAFGFAKAQDTQTEKNTLTLTLDKALEIALDENPTIKVAEEEVALKKDGNWIPKIKLSNDVSKTINPDFKKLYRAYDKETGYAIADIMARRIENVSRDKIVIADPANILKHTTITNFKLEKLQKTIFKNGELVYDDPEILEKQKYCNEQMKKIYPEVKRTKMPHEYYVDGTEEYVEFKNVLIDETKKIAKNKI